MAQNLQTNVIIGGQTTAGFNALGDKIAQLGAMIDRVGGRVREWEKDSLETYKNYETYMLEAKGAMSANYETTGELERAYDGLQKKAQEWAASTIFHTNDVSKAISEAAHAGWEYDEMLEGIPRAMLLAQAGNTDLSTGLDMLIKTINGTGIAFEDSGRFVDEWVMAANSSATTVSELGEAMERMGATARFGNSTAELLTMLGTLANTGTVGAQAGTLLRNSMIRLIAPTKAARDTMEGLGIAADEIEEAVGGDSEALAEVNAMLEQAGFSAYTTEGELKPFLTTFKDLYAATQSMTEEQRNKTLSTIFPTRTITGALALLEAASKDYDGLLEKITGSTGYAEEVAKTQVSGLMGAEELFASKWEEFSRKVGEKLSGPFEGLLDVAGKFVDTLNGLDEGTLGALTGAATAIAGAGPLLLTAGIGIKMFSFLGPWGTAIVTAAVGIGALVGYLTTMNELALENNFGQMSIDLEAVKATLGDVSQELSAKFAELEEFRSAAKEAAEQYQADGTKLAETLVTKMVTGAEITEPEKNQLKTLADKMIGELETALTTSAAEKIELANILFSNKDGAESGEADPQLAGVLSLITSSFDDAIAEANKKSQELRDALTSAFADGKLSDIEMQNIQEIMRQMNELMSDAITPGDVEKAKLLNKSQQVSLDSMENYTKLVNEAMTNSFAEIDDAADELDAYLRIAWDKARKNGTQFYDPATETWVNASTMAAEYIDTIIANNRDRYAQKKTQYGAEYDDMLMRAWDYAASQSDIGDIYTQAKPIIDMARSGNITYGRALDMIRELGGDQGMFGRTLSLIEDAFGGSEGLEERIRRYRELGGEENLARADWFEQIYGLLHAESDYSTAESHDTSDMMEWIENLNAVGADAIKEHYNSLNEESRAAFNQNIKELTEGYDVQAIARAFGLSGLDDQMATWAAAYRLANGYVENPEQFRATPEEAASNQHEFLTAQYQRAVEAQQAVVDGLRAVLEANAQRDGLPEGHLAGTAQQVNDFDAAFTKLAEMQKNLELMQESSINLEVEGDTTKLEMAVDEQNEQALLEYVDGDTEKLHLKIFDEDGQQLNEFVGGDISELKAAIDSQNGRHITVYVDKQDSGESEFAFGGRATEASIFGEAGPEWAIPERHDARTASLLNAAREASGFTWGELLSSYGGLNAGEGGGISVNIGSYSPIINANDARGVADELARDKERLTAIVKKAVRSAIEENRMRDAIEVYA